MGYLIDTNVLSEMRKGTRGNPELVARTIGIAQREMFLSVLVIGEVRRGIEGVRRRDYGPCWRTGSNRPYVIGGSSKR